MVRRNLIEETRELAKLRTTTPTKSGVMSYVEPLIELLGIEMGEVTIKSNLY